MFLLSRPGLPYLKNPDAQDYLRSRWVLSSESILAEASEPHEEVKLIAFALTEDLSDGKSEHFPPLDYNTP